MQIAKVISKLQQINSTNDKVTFLRTNDSDLLREVLQATYDPMSKYGIQKVLYNGNGTGTIESHWTFIEPLLQRLKVGHGSNELKTAVQLVMTQLTPQDAKVLQYIIRKDLEANVSVKLINKAFPSLINEFTCMLAKQYKSNLWRSDLMGSVKLDGLRCIVIAGKLYTRNGHPILGVTHIEKELEGITYVDGEILIPGVHFQKTSGALRKHENTPDAKLFLFDIIDPYMSFTQRYGMLNDMAQHCHWSMQLNKPTVINVLKHRTFKDEDEMKQVTGKVLDAGYEGLVLKTPEHKYQFKRSNDWLKVKNTLSEDVPIAGVYEGEGKYTGMLGGIIVQRLNGKLCKVGSGFSDKERYDFWQHSEVYIGHTVEILYHEETPDGDFRHARFKKLRPDLD